MAKSSEDVLLVVNHVKNKKCDGSLYVMSERVAWMPAGKDSFTYSYNYSDIKVQKISPETKDKVQLQIVLHSGGANTFHFANPVGRTAQANDRDGVKDLLQQMLPRFRGKKDVELEEKNRLFKDDPGLFQLYKDLVVGEVMGADEFWATRKDKLQGTSNDRQEIGVSAGFLADIRPVTDGCNGITYNLTADIMESIFRTYPTVREHHAKCVPDTLTEQQFWSSFFQSHYFHRDRINLGNKDEFFGCANKDDQTIQAELSKPVSDHFLDLTAMSDNTVDEEYRDQSANSSRSGSNPVNASLIKRFNQHSTMVLKSCDNRHLSSSTSSTQPTPSLSGEVGGGAGVVDMLRGVVAGHNTLKTSTATTNGSTSHHLSASSSSAVNNGIEDVPNKRAKLREKIELVELEESFPTPVGPSLTLSRVDAYFHGPTPEVAMKYNTSEDLIGARNAHTQEMMSWASQTLQILPPVAAYKVVQELGGSILQSNSKQQLHHMVSIELQQEVKHLYVALVELLRHFWACFPATTKELEDKVVRMKDCLQRFERNKLDPLRARTASTSYQNIDLVAHMRLMLDAAYSKFATWQTKKLQKRAT